MLKRLITVINWTLVIIWAISVGYLSLFYLGSEEQHEKLVKEPVNAFFLRFSFVCLVGILGIGILVLANYLLNRYALTRSQRIDIKKLFLISLATIISVSLVGTSLFISN
jgi:hypothetical protein